MDSSKQPQQNLAGLASYEPGQPVNRLRQDPTVDNRNAPWVEKYRPRQLDDVAAHTGIIDTIKRLTAENRLPHLLLYGPPGTGKTSTILAVARQIYGPALQNMTLELNASDERGISVVRQEVQDFASTKTIFSNKFKLIILDECDAMTKDAQFALRRIMEKYTRNARFCLICNYVSKIIPALQSRCTKFRFAPLEGNFVRERLELVVKNEGVKIGPGGMEALVDLGGGDMRRSLNIVQSCHMAFDQVDADAVYLCTGNPRPEDIETVISWLFNDSMKDAFSKVLDLQLSRGLALSDIVKELHTWIFRISMPTFLRIQLIEALADLEYRLATGTHERLQLGALCASFAKARGELAAAAQ